ncbi:hypothetical protein V500_00712 [Pseudogymnoascus sp. VKM F-4518 (FW-2643)]|nr:hypothetical protein V500_00712 [Pseudogymnoascus sp. VKM F-4518 (FW-2643)]
MSVSISQLAFEHHREALGIAESKPRISWRFEGNAADWEQSSYDIKVRRGRDDGPVSFAYNSSQSLFVPWPGEPLGSTERARVRARAHGNKGKSSTSWSDWVAVETGLLDEDDWAGAVPIASTKSFDRNQPKRPVYFRKPFLVNSKKNGHSAIETARLYITALGLYEAEINGNPVGDRVLAPGWQSYDLRHVYDTYDVTDLVEKGNNAIGIVVGEGWYAGSVFQQPYEEVRRNHYGGTIGPLCVLIVTLKDGTKIEVPTDSSWKAADGPITDSQIYDGEIYDSRLEKPIKGWSTASFKDDKWSAVKELSRPSGTLVPPDGPPVRRIQELEFKEIIKSPSGKTILDFGQNMAGWLKVTVKGPAGTNITLSHAEVLENGELALEPLRRAKARDIIILHDQGEQTWEPKFTSHGFRFAQVDGWPEDTPLTTEAIKGIVVHTDLQRTGWFQCSDELLNKLHSNVIWSMKGNFASIPTDCPQRDERVGWTGDAHVFGPTSNYLFDTSGFWKSWHKDVWLDMQRNNMIVPHWVPVTPPDAKDVITLTPIAVWGDVAVGSPWNLWRAFGDDALLKEQFEQSQAWIETGIPRGEGGLWKEGGFQYADWLAPTSTPTYLVADAYLVGMVDRLANMPDALGYEDLREKYRTQHSELRDTFRGRWINEGRMANTTQTAYALGLYFGLFEDGDLQESAETLKQLVAENDYLIGTGFAGTSIIGYAMNGAGLTDDFYKMLLQTKNPSWLYSVKQNVTTTWERWDSMLPDGSVNPNMMTSFNHYSFGSVADWMHGVIGGLAPGEPGWKRIEISPVPGGGITEAEATFVSGYGEIKTKWSIKDDGFHLDVQVPPNSKAVVTLPGSGKTIDVGSGTHKFHDSDV